MKMQMQEIILCLMNMNNKMFKKLNQV